MYIILHLPGRRFAADDDHIIDYIKMAAEDFEILQGPIIYFDCVPWVMKIIPRSLLNKWTRLNVIENHRDAFYAQCKVRFFTQLMIE